MMDTILNCGLHPGLADEVAEKGTVPIFVSAKMGLSPSVMAKKANFWMVYAQFCRQFGGTVAGIAAAAFDDVARDATSCEAASQDAESPQKTVARAYVALYEKVSGRKFPADPWQALKECIGVVFDSWNSDRAVVYRKAHGLEGLEGTAVNVQAMFNSWVSGIAFTANPSNPAAEELIIESSYGLGESVVSGDVTPDRFVLDAKSLRLKQRTIGQKGRVMAGLGHSGRAVDFERPEP